MDPALVARFIREVDSPDEVAHVLLKGHLLIEETLNRILEQYAFHRQHLAEARLNFSAKLSVARAFCLRKNEHGEWQLIGAINTLRNDLAHRLSSDERAKKIAKVRAIYAREAAGMKFPKPLAELPDASALRFACGHCLAYLSEFEGDSRAFRQLVHGIDRQINPNLPPFDL
jgi:hypothetical protein